MLAASHIGDSPARPPSMYDAPPSSSLPAGYPVTGSLAAAAIVPPRVSSHLTVHSAQPGGPALSPGAGHPSHSYGPMPSSRSPVSAKAPLPSPLYFNQSASASSHNQYATSPSTSTHASAAQSTPPVAGQRPADRAPQRSGSISGLRFMSITKAPRALKRLASAGTGALRDQPASNQLHVQPAYDEELESSTGHSSTQYSHQPQRAQVDAKSADAHGNDGSDENNFSATKPKGVSKARNLLRFGSVSASKTHQRERSNTTSNAELALEEQVARVKAAASQEQIALLAQGPGAGTSEGLIRKRSFTLRKRSPSFSSFAFPAKATATSQTVPSSPAIRQFQASSSDSGHSNVLYRSNSMQTTSSAVGSGIARAHAVEEKRHYPPPSASTGAAAASYGLSRSTTGGLGSIRRKPVPVNPSVDSTMLLQPSSFSSNSRSRAPQTPTTSDPVQSTSPPASEQVPLLPSRNASLVDATQPVSVPVTEVTDLATETSYPPSASKPAKGLKRSGSVGSSFLSRSNTFLSKASSSTFGSARRGRNARNGSSASINISGPVHLDADGEEAGISKLGGGATVISGGPTEAFALLAARTANPGASYLGSGMMSNSSASQALSPAGTSGTVSPTSPMPFSVLSRHGTSVKGDSETLSPSQRREGSLPLPKASSPASTGVGSGGGSSKSLTAPPRKSISASVRSTTPSGPADVVLPSEQIKSAESNRPVSPLNKLSMKAEMAQQLDEVLQHPEAPTRKLAHNHSRTLTPHSHAINAGVTPPVLVGEKSAHFAGASSGSTSKGKISRGSVDIGSSTVDPPIVTIGPLVGSQGKQSETDTESISDSLRDASEQPLRGLGFKEPTDGVSPQSYEYDGQDDAQRTQPRDVPTSPFSQMTTSPSSTFDQADQSSEAPASLSQSSTSKGRTRPHGRTRTLSLASLLGLGLPNTSPTTTMTTSAVSGTPNFSQVGSPAMASQGHPPSRKGSDGDKQMGSYAHDDSRRGSDVDASVSHHFSGATFGKQTVPSEQMHASRPISYATSGHEAANGHAPSQSSHQNRLWYSLSGRRGSIGASQTLNAGGAGAVGSSDSPERSGEDDFVPDLPPANLIPGTPGARHSLQSQGPSGSSGHGHTQSWRGSNAYTPSETASLDTDADVASVMNAQVVMASRIEVRRGVPGVANESRGGIREHLSPSNAGTSPLSAYGGPTSALDRPISLNDRQRQHLVSHTELEAARDGSKVQAGQTLRPLVVDDVPHRHSHQAVMMSLDDFRTSVTSQDGPLVNGVAKDATKPGVDAEFPVVPEAGEADVDASMSPTTPQGVDSSPKSTSSRRRACKISYATAEEAIAARKQEQSEREERQRVREAKRQAERQARYASKKKADPLLAARLALFGLQAPDADAGGADDVAESPRPDAGVYSPLEGARGAVGGAGLGSSQDASVDSVSIPRLTIDSDFASPRQPNTSTMPEPPLIDASELLDVDELDGPRTLAGGAADEASVLVSGIEDDSSVEFPYQVRVSVADPDSLPTQDVQPSSFASAATDTSAGRPDAGGFGAPSDWYSVHSSLHSHVHDSQAQARVQARLEAAEQRHYGLGVPTGYHLEPANRSSAASSQFQDYVTTMSHAE